MLFLLCKFTAVCHSIKNANQNKPTKQKTICECPTKKIQTEMWYLNLHLEFKQQLKF